MKFDPIIHVYYVALHFFASNSLPEVVLHHNFGGEN